MAYQDPSKDEIHLSPTQQKIITTESIILGFLLGAVMIWWAFPWQDGHISHGPVKLNATVETLLVALYLTMVVAYAGFRMPVFAAHSPRWSTFWLVFFAGHISLFFDSFAVVLLLASGVVFLDYGKTSHFNNFAVKAFASFTALTVGGGFYLGELWGLPYYITAGLAHPNAGWPLMVVLTPYCVFMAILAARFVPVKMLASPMDSAQVKAAIEFVVALLAIIITHNPFFCIGLLFLYSAFSGLVFREKNTLDLINNTSHELTEGGLNALGLITLAVIIQQIPGIGAWITNALQGEWVILGAAISSPFAGSMLSAPADLSEFYRNLSYLMLGAPLFVFSSLVAIVVFNDEVKRDELPGWMRKIAQMIGFRGAHVPEAIAYTLIVVPMTLGLAVLLYIANMPGLFFPDVSLFAGLGHMLGMDAALAAAQEAAAHGAAKAH